MTRLFSADFTFVTILGYPLSYIEFLGTLLYLLSVYLIVKRNLLTWPIGIVSVVFFMLLFYQIRLYSAAVEQIYYLVASGYGWWYWSRRSPQAESSRDVMFSPLSAMIGWLAATIILSAGLGLIMSRLHEWSPALFTEAASYPYVDASTTVTSLVAMWLMARKRIESWILWIGADLVSVWLYFVKGVVFVSLLYLILLLLATAGLIGWTRASVRRHACFDQRLSRLRTG